MMTYATSTPIGRPGALEGPAMSTYSGSGYVRIVRLGPFSTTNVRVALLHLVRAQRHGLAVARPLAGLDSRRRDG
jgi:hypothetical protein